MSTILLGFGVGFYVTEWLVGGKLSSDDIQALNSFILVTLVLSIALKVVWGL